MADPKECLALAGKIETDIVGWRREIHSHPELAYEEKRTAALVAETLDGLGLEVECGIAKTGVVARLRGENPGPVCGLRADMDALPICEETGLPFSSRIEGVMHACCHDGHVAMLLGAATILARLRASLSGEVVFIFQPAEEGQAGAKKMIDEGILRRFSMNVIFGHHIMPGVVPPKCILGRKGVLTANSDRFSMIIQGKGAHAAMPNVARDPVVAMGAMICGINTIISRNADPFSHAVISIGEASSGGAYNVIPDKALIKGSIRTTDTATQELIHKRLIELARGTGLSHGVEISCEHRKNYPGVWNNSGLTAQTLDMARNFWGESRVIEKETPFMISEDFAFFGIETPACFLMLGAEGENGLHHPAMVFNEDVLTDGAAWQAWLALEMLPALSKVNLTDSV